MATRDTFDYVVVGAGSAGCVLANRLTASGDRSVLLLEAGGPDDQRETAIPAAFSDLFETDADWAYDTEPQSELRGRELYWPRGKTLGGSSSINAMIYIRGHPSDYDDWAERGNDGWSFDEMLPQFRRAEDNARGADEYHGTDGPLRVEDLRDPLDLSRAFVDACGAVDVPHNPDFNGAEQAGAGLYQVTQKKGQRHSAADAYLKPVLDRENLTAETHAQVTQVRFEDGEAAGVTYEQDGETVRVDAEEEVVVSAGAVESPKLLMLSGVGPADHLREHGIDVVADRPGVGRNLQDHPVVPVIYGAEGTETLDDADSLWNLAKWFLLKQGPLTSNVAEAGAFVRTDDDLRAPDLQYHFGPAYFRNHGFDDAPTDAFSIGPTLVRPESRGRLELRSADPHDDPAIDPRYLTAERDLRTLVEGIELAREIAAAEPLADHAGEELHPGPDVQSEADLEDYVREELETLYHPVGTCRMGQGEDAVVDERLRVRGVSGLRVVDASVMPTVTTGNTNAPTIAIAEKAADVIRADRGA
ncbi:MAG: GMC family oxidoreductase [Haloarculaceae archaeon]